MKMLRWSRPFGRVWLSESLSMLGDQLQFIAFAWLVLEVSGSAATLAGVIIATTIPRALLVLVGGAVTDRISPRLVMAASHFARGGIVAVLVVLTMTGGIATWQLYAVGIAFGLADAFFWPASTSILPSLVAPSELPRANALVGTSEQFTMLVGPLLGGILVASGGATTAFGFNAASFLIAGAVVLFAPRGRPQAEGRHALLRDIRIGITYVTRSAPTRAILLLVAAGTLAYSGLFAVGLPALAQGSGSALALGAMVSAWGLGQLAGTLLATRTGLPESWGLLIIGVVACEVVSFVALGFLANPWAVAAFFVPLGALVAYQSDVALPTWIQCETPPELLGRVNSIIDLTRQTLQPLSLAMMGALAATNTRLPFWAASVPMVLAGILLACSPSARRLRRPDGLITESIPS